MNVFDSLMKQYWQTTGHELTAWTQSGASQHGAFILDGDGVFYRNVREEGTGLDYIVRDNIETYAPQLPEAVKEYEQRMRGEISPKAIALFETLLDLNKKAIGNFPQTLFALHRHTEELFELYANQVYSLGDVYKNLKPIPGMRNVLETLEAPFGIYTSGLVRHTSQFLAALGIEDLFKDKIIDVMGSSKLGGSFKPTVSGLLAASRALGWNPDMAYGSYNNKANLIYVEDKLGNLPPDITKACFTVLVSVESTQKLPQDPKLWPHLVVNGPEDLPVCFEALRSGKIPQQFLPRPEVMAPQ